MKICLHTESSSAEESFHTEIPAFVTSDISSHTNSLKLKSVLKGLIDDYSNEKSNGGKKACAIARRYNNIII